MPWDDDDFYTDEMYDSEYGIVSIMGVYYDVHTRSWRCWCPQFKERGNCRHLVPFKRVNEVQVKEEYL